MARVGNTKKVTDFAPRIRGGFVRALMILEEQGKPLSTILAKSLEERPIETLNAMSKYLPKEITISKTVNHDHKHTIITLDATAQLMDMFAEKSVSRGTIEGESVKELANDAGQTLTECQKSREYIPQDGKKGGNEQKTVPEMIKFNDIAK